MRMIFAVPAGIFREKAGININNTRATWRLIELCQYPPHGGL